MSVSLLILLAHIYNSYRIQSQRDNILHMLKAQKYSELNLIRNATVRECPVCMENFQEQDEVF